MLWRRLPSMALVTLRVLSILSLLLSLKLEFNAENWTSQMSRCWRSNWANLKGGRPS